MVLNGVWRGVGVEYVCDGRYAWKRGRREGDPGRRGLTYMP